MIKLRKNLLMLSRLLSFCFKKFLCKNINVKNLTTETTGEGELTSPAAAETLQASEETPKEVEIKEDDADIKEEKMETDDAQEAAEAENTKENKKEESDDDNFEVVVYKILRHQLLLYLDF